MCFKNTNARDPQTTRVWLVGGGIASLAAAVFLIKDAQVPGHNIHVLERDTKIGGGTTLDGDPEHGFVLYPGNLPYFHDRCVKYLLSLVPSAQGAEETLLDKSRGFASTESPPVISGPGTRLLRSTSDSKICDTGHLHIGPLNRLQLLKLLLESEGLLGGHRIEEFFGEEFFATSFWILWSTTFGLRPWHSAIEFQRYLRKHLADIRTLHESRKLDRTRFSLFESVVLPVSEYLNSEGVDFHFNVSVVSINMRLNNDTVGEPTTVSELILRECGHMKSVTFNPNDLAIVTVGSINSGTKIGTNSEPPPHHADPDDFIYDDWSLWFDLAGKSAKFESPLHFNSNIRESSVVTFTVTFSDSNFLSMYQSRTNNVPGAGAILSLPDSNWILSISVPHQPVFPNQPPNVDVIWGYGLRPEKMGNVIDKPMIHCTGEDIMKELLFHLGFPGEEILNQSITVPCFSPLATSAILPRDRIDRPEVIPPNTTNIGLIGQFTEVPNETTLTVEYSVRSAQLAVYALMGLKKSPPKVKRNILVDILDLLGEC